MDIAIYYTSVVDPVINFHFLLWQQTIFCEKGKSHLGQDVWLVEWLGLFNLKKRNVISYWAKNIAMDTKFVINFFANLITPGWINLINDYTLIFIVKSGII